MIGREKILNYCIRKLEETSVEHLEACKDIKNALEQNDIDYLDGHCPDNYGLDSYIGLCSIDKYVNKAPYDEQVKQCEKCWEIALK